MHKSISEVFRVAVEVNYNLSFLDWLLIITILFTRVVEEEARDVAVYRIGDVD
jgi:hypothetical protein